VCRIEKLQFWVLRLAVFRTHESEGMGCGASTQGEQPQPVESPSPLSNEQPRAQTAGPELLPSTPSALKEPSTEAEDTPSTPTVEEPKKAHDAEKEDEEADEKWMSKQHEAMERQRLSPSHTELLPVTTFPHSEDSVCFNRGN
jgi:hypothetical protein